MKTKQLIKKIYKYRWLILVLYVFFSSISIFTTYIAAKSPTFKYEVRCIDPRSEYLNVINTLKYKDEVTICMDNLKNDQLNGFYKSHSDYIYLDNNIMNFEKTIYHEYSHFLMAKKVKNTNVKKLTKEMNLTDEKLTDITAFFLLLENEKGELSNINIEQFSYLERPNLYSLDNEHFWEYIDEIYKVEGIKETAYDTFDLWIKSTNKLNGHL